MSLRRSPGSNGSRGEHHDPRQRRSCAFAASRRPHRRTQAYGSSRGPRRREASLRGRSRSASAGARRLEDVRHGRPLSYLPATTGLKPHLSSQSGGCANYLSRGSDSEHHPFTLDLCLVRLATVLVGQFVDVLSRLLTPHLRYDFPAHFDEAIGIFHIPDRDGHPRISFDVAKLLPVHFGIEQEVLLISIHPHHLRLRVATG